MSSSAPPRYSLFLYGGVVLAVLLGLALVMWTMLPVSPVRSLGFDLERLRSAILVERSVRLDCGEQQSRFVTQLHRLMRALTEGRLAEPGAEELSRLEQLVGIIRESSDDKIITAQECADFLTSSSSRLPLNIR